MSTNNFCDDGSPDNCREIVESLQLEYPNVIFDQPGNQGVSVPETTELTGQPDISFIYDPDDLLMPGPFHEF
jgi:glycosyltransferase involved in cell wall biosynthesis